MKKDSKSTFKSGHSLSQSVAHIGYLLNHYYTIMALHDKIIAEICLACPKPSPSNIPTVKIPSNSVQPKPSEAPEAIEAWKVFLYFCFSFLGLRCLVFDLSTPLFMSCSSSSLSLDLFVLSLSISGVESSSSSAVSLSSTPSNE